MNERKLSETIKDCLKQKLAAFVACTLVCLVFIGVFFLYGLDLEPFLYGGLLVLAAFIVYFIISTIRCRREEKQRTMLLRSFPQGWNDLPEAGSLMEADYQEMIRKLGQYASEAVTARAMDKSESVDYFTTWVHQIKTPIAVMKLILQQEDTEEHRELSAELFRIEQYVEMVLSYIRLGSDSRDLVIREYSVDELVRRSIRKYAPQIIRRRLTMNYEGCDLTILTDQKWFTLIIEQLLSNAVKYTPEGGISITVTDDRKLIVSDTGIGIATEDAPRIFEKGFTGNNGRTDAESTGLGLYLCRKAAELLHIRLSVTSTPGKGSSFILDLDQDEGAMIE